MRGGVVVVRASDPPSRRFCGRRGEGTTNVNSVGEVAFSVRRREVDRSSSFLASCLVFLNHVFVCKMAVASLLGRVVLLLAK